MKLLKIQLIPAKGKTQNKDQNDKSKIENKEEDQLEEIGYKIGTKGNICQIKLDEDIAKIEEDQKVIDKDYDLLQRTSQEETIGEQALNVAERFEEVLMRQTRLEQKKASVYERAYTEE